MAMSRSFGGTSLTTLSPMRISPSVISSSPAIIRSAVVFPHPEGPTSTMNSPSSMPRSKSSTARVSPYRLVTFSRTISANVTPLTAHNPDWLVRFIVNRLPIGVKGGSAWTPPAMDNGKTSGRSGDPLHDHCHSLSAPHAHGLQSDGGVHRFAIIEKSAHD